MKNNPAPCVDCISEKCSELELKATKGHFCAISHTFLFVNEGVIMY